MEELDFEKILFGEPEKENLKPLDMRWVLLPLILAVIAFAVLLWPRQEEPEATDCTTGAEAFYGVLAPDMVSCRVYEFSSGFNPTKYVWFTPSLDAQEWGSEKITFQINADSGSFLEALLSAVYVPEKGIWSVESGGTATWMGDDLAAEGTYVEFVARTGEYIIGYAVAEILPAEEQQLSKYTVKILGSAVFPLVDETFQPITEEYIRQQMDDLRTDD